MKIITCDPQIDVLVERFKSNQYAIEMRNGNDWDKQLLCLPTQQLSRNPQRNPRSTCMYSLHVCVILIFRLSVLLLSLQPQT